MFLERSKMATLEGNGGSGPSKRLDDKSSEKKVLFFVDRFGNFPWIWFIDRFNSNKLEDRSQNLSGIESEISASDM
ncbi:hypothetical protein ACFXTO_042821 [Malus domestica]